MNASITAILLAASAITDLVGQRVRPDELDENDSLPAIIVALESFEPFNTFDSSCDDTGMASVHILCCALDRSSADAVEQAVKARLLAYAGIQGDWKFDYFEHQMTNFLYETDDDGSEEDAWFINDVHFLAHAEDVS